MTDSSCSTLGRRLTVRSRVSSASVSKDWVRETTCTARSCWAYSPRGVLTESFLLAWGELVARGAQKIADLIEGIALASAVTGRVLLDAATHLTWGVASELDDAKDTSGAGGGLGAGQAMAFLYPWKGSSVAICTPARKSSPRSASQFSCAVPDLPGTRSTQAGRGMILPACQVHDAGEFTWALVGVGPGGAIRARQPPAPERLRSGRGHQMRLAGTA